MEEKVNDAGAIKALPYGFTVFDDCQYVKSEYVGSHYISAWVELGPAGWWLRFNAPPQYLMVCHSKFQFPDPFYVMGIANEFFEVVKAGLQKLNHVQE